MIIFPQKAYAKINIGLKILSKRPDGYHNLETIFHRINLYDELLISINDKIILESNNPEIPTNENNICIKAFQYFKEAFNIKSGIKIILEKNIPVGAGLGGGSSDAATLLNSLPNLFGLKVNVNVLEDIAKQLGADVPYFLKKGSAYATEKGNNLKYFNLNLPYWIITITPHINISTKWAYENLVIKNHVSETANLLEKIVDNVSDKFFLRDNIINDFEELVFSHFPSIRLIKEELYSLGADFALLSGTGSTVFAFVSDRDTAYYFYQHYHKQYKVSITEPGFNP